MTKTQLKQLRQLYAGQPLFDPLFDAAEKAIAEHSLLVKTVTHLRRQVAALSQTLTH